MSNFCPDTGGGGSHFFRLTCSVLLWGGRNTANKYHWHVLAVSGPHWVCPHLRCACFPSLHCLGSRLLCQELSEVALSCMHFPGLRCSDSGSWVLHNATDSIRRVFCALPRSEQLRQPGALRAHSPRWAILITSPVPRTQFHGCTTRTPSQVSHVSPLGS